MPADESLLLLSPDRYVLRACRRLGIAPVVVYGAYHRDTGLQEITPPAVPVFCESHRSPDAILSALHRAGYAGHRFATVQTTNEYLLITAALIGRALGARAISLETAVLFRDKYLQKQRIREAGLSAARSVVIEDIFQIDDTFAFPYDRGVLKPATGAGTETTSVVNGLGDLLATANEYRGRRIASRTFVLEEFVAGDEWTADGVVSDGEVLFYGLGRYDQPCLATLTSKAALRMRKFDPGAEGWAYAAADDTIRRAITALGLTDGVFHMELFHDAATGRLTFSECAARRGGGLTAEEVLAKFNVDLGDAAVQCALGSTPKLDVRVRPGAVGMVYLPCRPGVLVSCPSPVELTALPGVEFARIELPFGAMMGGAFDSTTTRVGMAMLTAVDPGALERTGTEVQRWFDERLVVVPAGATGAGLREWHRGLGDAYEFADTAYGE